VEDKTRVMLVSSECHPFIKTGGLGDVIGSLPYYLTSKVESIIVVLPLYKGVKRNYFDKMKYEGEVKFAMSWRNQTGKIYSLTHNKVDYYFVENDQYFDLENGEIYQGYDQIERFAFFNIASLELLKLIKYQPNVIHANDWQTSMTLALYKEIYKNKKGYKNIKTLLTIHNPAFQGMCDKEALGDLFNLPDSLYDQGIAKFKGRVSTLKTGIMYADFINTVSPNNAREILEGFYSYDLEQVLKYRKDDFFGVLNGIDYNVYSPEEDELIYERFNFETIEKKKENKKAIQEMFNIEVNPNKILCGVVSRLTYQKGIVLILESIPWMVANNFQLIVLGGGEKGLEEGLQYYRDYYPDSIGIYTGYDDDLAHRVYSSLDLYLMPSLYEPCGLSQMVAQRYGSVPIVRLVGGLKDSVNPYNEYTKVGTGFGFNNFSSKELRDTLYYARDIYLNKKEDFKNIIRQCMEQNNSWSKSANEYKELYERLLKEK